MPPSHKVSKEEKEASIRKFEERHKAAFDLNAPKMEEDEPKLTPMPYGQVKIEQPDKKCVSLENGDCVGVNCMHDAPKPVISWAEFNLRLDNLVKQSEDTLRMLKERFGE
jgi:hypothetical protein